MPRLCTGCGLTNDDDGNLIANVSGGTYEDTYTCGAANGGKVYCSSATGKLYVDPPPMYREWKFVSEWLTSDPDGGELTLFGFNESMDFPATKTKELAGGTITNPSTCSPMKIWVEGGIQHGLFSVDSGGPDPNDFARGDIQIESYVNLTGAVVAPLLTGGHQHWGGVARAANNNQREIYRFDSSGAYLDVASPTTGLPFWEIPPGGVLNLTLTAKIIVIRYTTTGAGKVTLENFRIAARVRGWTGA